MDEPIPTETATAGPPRWVKVFGLIALGVVAMVIVMLLTGGPSGGGHGPGRHSLPAGDLWFSGGA